MNKRSTDKTGLKSRRFKRPDVMNIEIKVFSSIRNDVKPSDKGLDRDKWDVQEGATVGHVLEMLQLSGRDDLILLVNGHHANKESVLSEGDVLSILPPIGGG
jgi:molybdopterin converting factor small subunit